VGGSRRGGGGGGGGPSLPLSPPPLLFTGRSSLDLRSPSFFTPLFSSPHQPWVPTRYACVSKRVVSSTHSTRARAAKTRESRRSSAPPLCSLAAALAPPFPAVISGRAPLLLAPPDRDVLERDGERPRERERRDQSSRLFFGCSPCPSLSLAARRSSRPPPDPRRRAVLLIGVVALAHCYA
jgi:hypothetical protein